MTEKLAVTIKSVPYTGGAYDIVTIVEGPTKPLRLRLWSWAPSEKFERRPCARLTRRRWKRSLTRCRESPGPRQRGL